MDRRAVTIQGIPPPEMHNKLKARKNSPVYDIDFSGQIVLEICTEHHNDIAVLCVKFQNNLTTEK